MLAYNVAEDNDIVWAFGGDPAQAEWLRIGEVVGHVRWSHLQTHTGLVIAEVWQGTRIERKMAIITMGN